MSLVVHAALVVVLGWWATAAKKPADEIRIEALTSLDEDPPLITPADLQHQPTVASFESPQHIELPHTQETVSRSVGAQMRESGRIEGAARSTPWSHFDVELPLGDGSLFRAFDGDVEGALAGRGSQHRAKLLEEGGGTPDTEAAVERGLRWLAAHQLDDGSWRFDLRQGICQGLCRDSGSEPSTTASTALALLAFLGRGETHREGEFHEQVAKGLKYLCGPKNLRGDIRDGSSMYCQGLAAIAVCEAYAMTRDASLEEPAQQAVDFIVAAQDKRGGGWRYQPRMPGDTTVSGWQIMALKSAQMAYLRVPQSVIADAVRFLDSVQDQQGAKYRYLPGKKNLGKDLTTTAVGLLCRMYTGWPREYTPLQEGVRLLSAEGPTDDNMYYNYYGTQVMHHWGGEYWRFWNYRMRDLLVRTQATEGHEAGSWYFGGGRGNVGGRLYNTALAVMTLEVYYRHMPLYRDEATDD